MVDTARTKAAMATLLADNVSGDISPQDVRDLMESAAPPHGFMYFSSAAETTIGSAGVYVKAAGTTAAQEETGVTVATTNRVTYDGALTRDFTIQVTVSVSLAAGGANDNIGIKIAKNDTPIDGSEIRRYIGTATQTGAMACQWHVPMATDDYVEIWVANIDATANVTIDFGQLFMTGEFE